MTNSEIAKCPWCKTNCQPSLIYKFYYYIDMPCGARGPLCDTKEEALNRYASLCEDIERGRKADEHMKRFVTDQELLTTAIAKGELAVEALSELMEAAQHLYDEQNGPPLLRDQESWNKAMLITRAAIIKAEKILVKQ